jgi:hypothetical protein
MDMKKAYLEYHKEYGYYAIRVKMFSNINFEIDILVEADSGSHALRLANTGIRNRFKRGDMAQLAIVDFFNSLLKLERDTEVLHNSPIENFESKYSKNIFTDMYDIAKIMCFIKDNESLFYNERSHNYGHNPQKNFTFLDDILVVDNKTLALIKQFNILKEPPTMVHLRPTHL